MNTLEALDQEVKELLANYKNKKTSVYEPCTKNNFKECLIGLREELSLLNINYIFNPYLDVPDGKLTPESLVALINAVYTVLFHYKNKDEKVNRITEENHMLEHSNKQLNAIVKELREKLKQEKNEARACVVTAQRVSDQSDKIVLQLSESRNELTRVKKQKETQYKMLKNEIGRLRLENEKLQDQLRGKSGCYTSCSEVCHSTINHLKEREKKLTALVIQLKNHNQQVIRETIALKEELLITALNTD